MQPILAESAPHRGRAVALAALAVVTSLVVFAVRPHHHRGHHRVRHGHADVMQIGRCMTSHGAVYRVVVR